MTEELETSGQADAAAVLAEAALAEAAAPHDIVAQDESTSDKPAKPEKYKPTRAERALRFFSIMSLIAGFFLLLTDVLLGVAGFVLGANELAESLDMPVDSVYVHYALTLVIATVIAVLGILHGIFGIRSRKHHKEIQIYIILSGLSLAYNAVDAIWHMAMGEYADVGSIIGALVGIAYDVLVVYIGFVVKREYTEGSEYVEVKRAARAEKKANSLGFLRIVMWLYGINIVLTFISLIITSRDNMVYDFSNIADWITIVIQAVCVYVLWKRLNIAREIVFGLTLVSIMVKTVDLMLFNAMSIPAFLFVNAFDFTLLAYLFYAKRPLRLLTNTISFKLRTDVDEGSYIATKGWRKWRNLILYYCVFSVLGHWMELAFCMLIRAGVVAGDYDPTNTMLWRDLLFPFPMEGIAVVICALWLYPFKNWLIEKIDKPFLPLLISFVVNGLLCTCIEFIGGITFNAQHQHWDYSDLPFNFMGQVCLQNAIGFALICTLIVWVVYPAMERAISRVPDDVMNLVFVGVFTFNMTLQVLYLIEPTKIAEAFSKLGSAAASIGS